VLSRNLEKSLHRALAHANERRHEYATLDHLLLALTEDEDAVAVMSACSVDLDRFCRGVLNYVDNELANLVATNGDDAKPTASFQRVLQRAAIHVQSSGREKLTGANVLVAMFAERENHAVCFLQEQGVTRFDAVNYVSHGSPKRPSARHRQMRFGQRPESLPMPTGYSVSRRCRLRSRSAWLFLRPSWGSRRRRWRCGIASLRRLVTL
jgi:ATP-dependent Clp protease ATP-binding subunit ClpA